MRHVIIIMIALINSNTTPIAIATAPIIMEKCVDVDDEDEDVDDDVLVPLEGASQSISIRYICSNKAID